MIMAAKVYQETTAGLRVICNLLYGTVGNGRTKDFVDFQVWRGGVSTDEVLRIVPKYSEAPFAPRGAHIILSTRNRNHDKLPSHVTIGAEQVDLTRLVTLRGENITLLRLGTRRKKYLHPNQIVVRA